MDLEWTAEEKRAFTADLESIVDLLDLERNPRTAAILGNALHRGYIRGLYRAAIECTAQAIERGMPVDAPLIDVDVPDGPLDELFWPPEG